MLSMSVMHGAMDCHVLSMSVMQGAMDCHVLSMSVMVQWTVMC